MFTLFRLIAIFCALPVFAHARMLGDADSMFGNASLWVAVIIGCVSSILTLVYSFRMSGSTVADILRPIGIGMLTLIIALVSLVVGWADPVYQRALHDLLFVAGYVAILIGVLRMRRLTL